MSVMSVSKALCAGLREEMLRDEKVMIMGEDVGVMGSSFAVTRDLMKEFGELRVRDTPISESGFCGMAVGMAMRGIRPVVELMYDDFITVCLDPVMNQAAKMRYMTGGQVKMPVVYRMPMGAGRRNAGQHSQCLESLFMHIPGLKVVAPSTPADAKGLIKSAIRCEDPVIFLENKLMYARKGEVPEEEYIIPIGKADVKRPGKDVTILTWSRQVYFALEAAEQLAQEGIDAEIIDLRSLVPMDWDCIRESLCKTHHLMVVEEGVKRCSVGSEIAAQVQEELFDELDAPIARVAGANVVSPFSPPLEDAVFPHTETIVAEVHKLLNR